MIALLLAAATAVTGDFDHDGRRDVARIERSHGGVAIVIIDGKGRRHLLDRNATDPYLELNRTRGRVKTACGKGYDLGCGPRDPNTVQLRGGELVFGQRESTSFVVIWTGARYRIVQLSD